ncbi:hypothetical protein BT63DRAFT_308908 [Microthyrium microscopicum]|uniref:Uncharacterized protein n=1 Tax=Microthyrium microscopicum TaxID=703497 RepID=A0A6A6UAZ5_9PEZI|nr:hypothetical protein BT63DRAFT_308908 [Microthyrium microscopicum]
MYAYPAATRLYAHKVLIAKTFFSKEDNTGVKNGNSQAGSPHSFQRSQNCDIPPTKERGQEGIGQPFAPFHPPEQANKQQNASQSSDHMSRLQQQKRWLRASRQQVHPNVPFDSFAQPPLVLGQGQTCVQAMCSCDSNGLKQTTIRVDLWWSNQLNASTGLMPRSDKPFLSVSDCLGSVHWRVVGEPRPETVHDEKLLVQLLAQYCNAPCAPPGTCACL